MNTFFLFFFVFLLTTNFALQLYGSLHQKLRRFRSWLVVVVVVVVVKPYFY